MKFIKMYVIIVLARLCVGKDPFPVCFIPLFMEEDYVS